MNTKNTKTQKHEVYFFIYFVSSCLRAFVFKKYLLQNT